MISLKGRLLYAQENVCVAHYKVAQRHLNCCDMHVSATHNSIVKLIVTLNKEGHESGTCWKVGIKARFLPSDLLRPKKEKERSANWLANSPQTDGQLALPACRPPPLGCLATPSILLGCLMTLVVAVAQGLLMKPRDRLLLFKTWKLIDHWTGT